MEAVSPTYYLVFNTETTCDVSKQLDPREIIELSVVAVSADELLITSDFQRFVRPEVHPELTPFCVAETGVGQSQVDQSDVLEDIMAELEEWVDHLPADASQLMIISYTHPQMLVLKEQSSDEELNLPSWLDQWVNLRRSFKRHFYLKRPQSLNEALNYLGIEAAESGQSGIDKAHNAAKLLIDLIKLDARMVAVSDQDSYKSDKPAVQEKPGDWRCDGCNFLNFARRNFCKDCGSAKPGYTPSQNPRPQNSGESRPGDWNCERCNFSNFARRKFCKDCGASRPGGAAQPSGGGYGGGGGGYGGGGGGYGGGGGGYGGGGGGYGGGGGGYGGGGGGYGGGGGGGGGYGDGGGSGVRGNHRGPRMKPGDWKCPDCSFINFARRTSCKDCGCQRPEREIGQNHGRPGDWNCSSCDYHNFAYRDACGQCGDAKPS